MKNYDEIIKNICELVIKDITTFFKDKNCNYVDVELFTNVNETRTTPYLLLGCADCSWIKKVIFINDKLYITVCECEIYDDDEVLELGKDYNIVESIVFLYKWLGQYDRFLAYKNVPQDEIDKIIPKKFV